MGGCLRRDFRIKWHLKDSTLNLACILLACHLLFIMPVCHPQNQLMGVCITRRWYQSCKGLYWSEPQRIILIHCTVNHILTVSGIFTSRSGFCPDQQPTEDPDVQVYLGVVALLRPWLHSDPCGLLLPGSGFTSHLNQESMIFWPRGLEEHSRH